MVQELRTCLLDRRWQLAITTILIVSSTLITRWYSLGIYELDWDEANRMAIAHSLNHGRTLYVDAWDHHTFLDILFFQQIFRLFSPENAPTVIHLFNILTVCTISTTVYLLIRAGTSSYLAALFGACVALNLFPHEFFRSSHGELYHSLTSIVGFAVYFLGRRQRFGLLAVGVLFSAGFFIKQTAIFDVAAFLVVQGVFARYRKDSTYLRELAWVGIVAGLVIVGSMVYFLAHGSLLDAVYGTFLDAFVYATGRGIQDTLVRYQSTFRSELEFLCQMHWLILAALAGAYVGLYYRGQDPTKRFLGIAALAWFLSVLFGVVCIGRFYHHYFIQLVAPLALACGYAAALIPFRVRFLTLGASAYLYFYAIIDQKVNYFVFNPENNCRDIETIAPFVKTHTKPGEPLFLYQNSALCLYYLSERFPPMKVFMYAQMLPENKDGPGLLEDGLRRWKRNPPKLVVTGALSYRIPQIEALIERDFSFCTNIGIFRIHKRKAEEPKLANDRPQ